jgi:DNA-binding NarL/FixJ family response regulator
VTANSVVVFDSIPVYRWGVSQALAAAGFDVDEAIDVIALRGQLDVDAIVLTIRGPADYAVVRNCVQTTGVPIIALVASHSCGDFVAALHAGAHSTGALDTSIPAVCEIVATTIQGFGCAPPRVIAPMASSFMAHALDMTLSEHDLHVLQCISEGCTVAKLAKQEGFSERTMYRRLRELYARIGASTRTDAIHILRSGGYIPSPFALSLSSDLQMQ